MKRPRGPVIAAGRTINTCGFFSALTTHHEAYASINDKLSYEKDTLKKMNQKGLPVPTLIDMEVADAFVTEYLEGENPKDIFKDKRISLEDKLTIVRKLSSSLSQIHENGFFHGASTLSNTRYSNSIGYWVDFGTIPKKGLALDHLQAKDLNGFIYSACRNCSSNDIQKDMQIVNEILKAYAYRPVLDKLRDIQPQKISFLYAVLSRKRKPFAVENIRKEIVNILGKDL